MIPKLRALPLAALLIAGILQTPWALAQDESADSPPPVPDQRTSAQATVTSFLEAFALVLNGAPGDPMQEAVSALDLSAYPSAVRDSKGRELAVLLKDVLDRTAYIETSEIPSQPDGSPYTVAESPVGKVVVARGEDGQWRFTAQTVSLVPAMADALSNVDLVEGVEAASRELSPSLWLRSQMPQGLRTRAFLLEQWQWLGLGGLLLLGYLALFLISRWVARFWRLLLQKVSPEGLDPKALVATSKPLGIVAMALTWKLGFAWLGLPAWALQVAAVAVTFLIAAGVVWAAYKAVDLLAGALMGRAERSENHYDELLIPLGRKTIKVLIAAFGLVFIAQNLDLPVTSLLAGISLGGLALALAAQDMVKNLFGSVTVILDQPFKVGDWIDTKGIQGTVEELGFRSTRIRTPYDSLVTLPNSNLIDASVDNYGERTYRRWKTTLTLTYDTSPERLELFCEGLRELIRQHPHTRKEGFYVAFREFGPSSLDVLLQLFFAVPSWKMELEARHRLGLDILRLAAKLGVEFAYPTQTLHLMRGEAPESPESSADAAALARELSEASDARSEA